MNLSRNLLPLLILSILVFASCSKKSNDSQDYGTKVNTWTFTEGTTVYKGKMLFESTSFNTNPGSSGPYQLGVIGAEESTGHIFNVVLDLLDTTFTVKNYKSGVEGTDYWNGFFYSETFSSIENIYESTDLDPGAEMNYTILSFDKSKSMVTIAFSGEAFDIDGNKVSITNGKFAVAIE